MADLTLTTIQSPNSEFIPESVANYLAFQLKLGVKFVDDIPWNEREKGLDSGQIDIGWICGLPYIHKADQPDPKIKLLAAPVISGYRYQDSPIYFSDVVVHVDSAYQTFEDLRGATWAFNEPGSQSGYNITRYYLAAMGEKEVYFGKALQAGSHEKALQWVLDKKIEAAAIDSTVLEIEIRRRPDIEEQLRIVEILGPSPIPPYVISTELAEDLIQEIRAILLDMHNQVDGQALLKKAGMLRFETVKDADYDIIREMEAVARGVILGV